MGDAFSLIGKAVLALAEHGTKCDTPEVAAALGYLVEARNLLRAEPDTLVTQLRRLQYAANMLNGREFCQATGWPEDDYSKAKFLEFQRLGRLHVFDDHVLEATVTFYEKAHAHA
jgi:hypothetical protein